MDSHHAGLAATWATGSTISHPSAISPPSIRRMSTTAISGPASGAGVASASRGAPDVIIVGQHLMNLELHACLTGQAVASRVSQARDPVHVTAHALGSSAQSGAGCRSHLLPRSGHRFCMAWKAGDGPRSDDREPGEPLDGFVGHHHARDPGVARAGVHPSHQALPPQEPIHPRVA